MTSTPPPRCLWPGNLVLTLVATAILAASAGTAQASARVYYVAANGADLNTGTYTHPFATIAKARNTIRQLKAAQGGLTQPVEVRIRGGVYRLPGVLAFSPEDSGTAACPITYRAYNNETVVISGARIITAGWTPVPGMPETYQCRVDTSMQWPPPKRITHLFCDGVEQPLARYPNSGWMFTQSTGYARRDAAKLPEWHSAWAPALGVEKPELVTFVEDDRDWLTNVLQFSTVDAPNRTVYFPGGAQNQALCSFSSGRRCYVRNVLSELDSRGEWYLEHLTATLTFRAPDGASPADHLVELGYLDRLIDVVGTTGSNVQYLNFRGLTFTCTTAYEFGAVEYPLEGAIRFEYADNCSVEDCRINDVAANGILLYPYARHITVKNCKISRCGACGILVPHSAATWPSNHIISGNDISDIGKLHKGTGAIELWHQGGNIIEYNYLHDLPRWAVALPFQMNGGNIVRYNEMRNCDLETGDGGFIHPSSNTSPRGGETGSEIAYNLMVNDPGLSYDTNGQVMAVNYTFGIHLDENASGYNIHHNIMKDTWSPAVNSGRNVTFENNFFINGTYAQILTTTWGTNNTIRRNIFLYTNPSTYYMWVSGGQYCDYNLIFRNGYSVTPYQVSGASNWTQWKNKGYDTHSVIANPLFSNVAAEDFTLQAGSPALSLGIQQIDLSPAITTQPVSLFVRPGGSATFSVLAGGLAPRYQWRFRAKGSGAFGAIPGATSSTYTIDSAAAEDAGSYLCDISNPQGSVQSLPASLTLRTSCDFDGDGSAEFVTYDQVGNDVGNWSIKSPITLTETNSVFGTPGDLPVPGDYDGDGYSDYATYTPNGANAGLWRIRSSATGATWTTQLGTSDDIPVPGDYDGDGWTDCAAYRARGTSTGTWTIRSSRTGQSWTAILGGAYRIPVPGDYDGDGATDYAVYTLAGSNAGIWSVKSSASGSSWWRRQGSPGDIPVPGDYDGDGWTDYAVYTPDGQNAGCWSVRSAKTEATWSVQHGNALDNTPVPGDYDGDGYTDYAVYRPTEPYLGCWTVYSARTGAIWNCCCNGSTDRVPVYDSPYARNGFITLQPTSQTVTAGQSVTLSVSATGLYKSYRWYRNEVWVADTSEANHTIHSTTLADSGQYHCVIAYPDGSTLTSSTATLVVRDLTPPTVPSVSDDGIHTTSEDTLRASWSSTDPESGIIEYQYAIGTTPSVPASGFVVGWTSAGTGASASVSGLQLQNGITYYFYVKARNAADLWSGVGVSDGITAVRIVGSIPALRSQPPNTAFVLPETAVTAAADGLVFVQETDRTSGLKLNWLGASPAANTLVVIAGTYLGVVNNEPTADALSIEHRAAHSVRPLGMANCCIGRPGSGNLSHRGTDTRCLLVTTWGKVTHVDSGFFLLDDGSGVSDSQPSTGKKGVKVQTPASAVAPGLGRFVIVTGVSRLEPGGTGWVMPRSATDIRE